MWIKDDQSISRYGNPMISTSSKSLQPSVTECCHARPPWRRSLPEAVCVCMRGASLNFAGYLINPNYTLVTSTSYVLIRLRCACFNSLEETFRISKDG